MHSVIWLGVAVLFAVAFVGFAACDTASDADDIVRRWGS